MRVWYQGLLAGGLLLALLLTLLAPGPSWSAAAAPVPPPRDPSGARPAARVLVTVSGMQRLGAADLAAVGLDPAQVARMQLWRAGVPVALEQRGAGANLELRFFAPPVGDRWNLSDTYWLTLETEPGLRMQTRTLAPAAAAGAPGLAEGRWRALRLYDSLTPGPAGDHWFAASLMSDQQNSSEALTATLGLRLPAAEPPELTLTLWGTALTPGAHSLEVTVHDEAGSQVQAQVRWSGKGNFTQTLSIAAPGDQLELRLAAGLARDQVLLGGIDWVRPVQLTLDGAGAAFGGAEAMQSYRLSGVPSGATLYDVSAPARPQVLSWTGTGFSDAGARRYVLFGANELQRPQLLAYTGLELPLPGEAIYIAPLGFHAALAPLLEQRRATGRSVALVDVQTIYDAWSFGQVDPEAIRSFLRYAATNWPIQPLAATLVGKGTRDPWGHSGYTQPNWVPPYLAFVDPWLGETACEPCYGQLDGASPLDDDMPDLAIGRLPVKDVDELAVVVAKILAYETPPDGLNWRSRVLLVADNANQADGTPDPAGDFARFLDRATVLLPAGVLTQRVYYDPWQRDALDQPISDQPWRERDAAVARARVRAELDAGAGLVVYAGHASQWQWAETGPPLPPEEQNLLGLYSADELTNGSRLPVVLGMTCMTAAFHLPSFSGTSLDERLLLSAQGGAVAIWGSTGLGVSHGHEALLRGFLGELAAAAGQPTLGELTLAGLDELRGDGSHGGGIYASTLRTYALLGDPLTPLRLERAEQVWLPLVVR